MKKILWLLILMSSTFATTSLLARNILTRPIEPEKKNQLELIRRELTKQIQKQVEKYRSTEMAKMAKLPLNTLALVKQKSGFQGMTKENQASIEVALKQADQTAKNIRGGWSYVGAVSKDMSMGKATIQQLKTVLSQQISNWEKNLGLTKRYIRLLDEINLYLPNKKQVRNNAKAVLEFWKDESIKMLNTARYLSEYLVNKILATSEIGAS
ncbi:MAG: hypothetical protein JW725_01355 [Candidatus Babeliaceae bacterium]|nr:hypothetical protein [Candidatus Babeliaceae bacterium]